MCFEGDHKPLHYGPLKPGEKHMRTDNCLYCRQRIISLHTGWEWDKWRTVSSVRPAVVIQEWPF